MCITVMTITITPTRSFCYLFLRFTKYSNKHFPLDLQVFFFYLDVFHSVSQFPTSTMISKPFSILNATQDDLSIKLVVASQSELSI